LAVVRGGRSVGTVQDQRRPTVCPSLRHLSRPPRVIRYPCSPWDDTWKFNATSFDDCTRYADHQLYRYRYLTT
jgi:hypothetical protein